MTLKPGDRVRDKITGATGIIICRSEWQYGCVRVTIQPETVKEDKPTESFTIDEPQAELVGSQAVPAKAKSAGWRPDPAMPADVAR